MKNKNIKFIAESDLSKRTIDVYHSIQVIYDTSDVAFGLKSINGGGDFSLYLDDSYVCIDFDIATKRVSGLNGMFYLEEATEKKIDVKNNIFEVVLLVKGMDGFTTGGGWNINFNYVSFYDKNNKILQFGYYNAEKPLFKFLKNAYAQITEDKNLQCIIIIDIY